MAGLKKITKMNEYVVAESEIKSNGYYAVFEDDGKTAYAYLLHIQQICGDVWIYNREPTPESPEWLSGKEMPFLNSREFVSPQQICPVSSEDEVSFVWSMDGASITVDIFIRNELSARISRNGKPGWAISAIIDGPLAKVLK